jgi:hypothetical protein
MGSCTAHVTHMAWWCYVPRTVVYDYLQYVHPLAVQVLGKLAKFSRDICNRGMHASVR